MVRRGWDRIDTGSYRPSDVMAYAAGLVAAREMADDELAGQLQDALDREMQPETVDGATRYEGASTCANLLAAVGRFNRVAGWERSVAEGPEERVLHGPRLEEAPYPQVLVARADTDGAALELVLHPGGEPGRYALGLAGLRAGEHYEVAGATTDALLADELGTAPLVVDLTGRTEIRVTPRP